MNVGFEYSKIHEVYLNYHTKSQTNFLWYEGKLTNIIQIKYFEKTLKIGNNFDTIC